MIRGGEPDTEPDPDPKPTRWKDVTNLGGVSWVKLSEAEAKVTYTASTVAGELGAELAKAKAERDKAREKARVKTDIWRKAERERDKARRQRELAIRAGVKARSALRRQIVEYLETTGIHPDDREEVADQMLHEALASEEEKGSPNRSEGNDPERGNDAK